MVKLESLQCNYLILSCNDFVKTSLKKCPIERLLLNALITLFLPIVTFRFDEAWEKNREREKERECVCEWVSEREREGKIVLGKKSENSLTLYSSPWFRVNTIVWKNDAEQEVKA